MSVDGNWNLTISDTPMGDIKGSVDFKADGATLTGTLNSPMGSESFDDGSIDGDTLKWAIKISSPMPMTLSFSATVNGDELSGDVGLGMLGSATLSGQRA